MVVLIDYFRYICDYNQIEMNTIDEKELRALRELNQSISSNKNDIADNAIRLISAYQRVMSAAGRLNSFNEEIEKKYGQVNINIETGEYTNQENISGE